MKRWRWSNGPTLAGLVVLSAAPASALTCGQPGGYFPTFVRAADTSLAPRQLPSDTLLVTECSTDPEIGCLRPLLVLREQEVELVELDRRPLLGDASLDSAGVPQMQVIRFVPSTPLIIGETYDFAIARLDTDLPRYVLSSVSVVDVADEPPPLPVVRAVDYTVQQGFAGPIRGARFELEPIEGLLVADVAEPDEDPWQSISLGFVNQTSDALGYSLGRFACASNFYPADLGVTTAIRFGQLDPGGRFSGWGPTYLVSYPERESQTLISGSLIEIDPASGEVLSVTDPEPPAPLPNGIISPSSGCSLSAPASDTSTAPWLLALMALYASRWRSSAASGSTSSRSRRSSV